MIVFKDIDPLSKHIATLKAKGLSIGFVPTMGALHAGHLSLVERSNQTSDITIASIFVNPTQFNDPGDFEKYPVTIDSDIAVLQQQNCDILFLPSIASMYPNGIKPERHYEIGELEKVLEGKFRPGHFQGVAQVVHLLLDIVTPDFLFLGSKDFQQCLVLTKLVKLVNSPTKVISGETYREPNGLAMSSRNFRLSEHEKDQATAIYKALLFIKEKHEKVEYRDLEREATELLLSNGFSKVDYVSIANANTLQPAQPGEQTKLIALVAAYIQDVRLIDNMVISD